MYLKIVFIARVFQLPVSQSNFCGAMRVILKVIYARRNAIIGKYNVNSRGTEFKFEKPPPCVALWTGVLRSENLVKKLTRGQVTSRLF